MKDVNKGEFQHKLFKIIIIIIIFVFFILIYKFFYITFFSSNNNNNIPLNNFEKLLKLHSNKINNLNSNDEKFFKQYNNNFLYCNLDNFVIENINKNLPCIININNSDFNYKNFIENLLNNNIKNNNFNNIEKFFLFEDYFNFIDFKYYNNSNVDIENYLKLPILEGFSKIFINFDNNEKHFIISPISQILKLKVYKNEISKNFNSIYCSNNFYNDTKNGENKIIKIQAKINKGELLYIPSYYFVQTNTSLNNVIEYNYNDNNQILDLAFKTLFDDELFIIEEEY